MDHKYIVCIDIETTGTEAYKHSIFQIGAVIVDTAFSTVGANNLFIKPLDREWDKRAQDVHGVTPEDAWNMGVDPNETLEIFEKWAQEVTGDSRPILASWGTYFDIAFLKATYERLNRPWVWQRKCIDLKTIAWWEMSRRGETVNGVAGTMEKIGLPFIGTQHDGFDDIINTVSMLNVLNHRRKDLSVKGDTKEIVAEADVKPKGEFLQQSELNSHSPIGRTLTIDDIERFSPGSFAAGMYTNPEHGIEVAWVAVRGNVADWAIYFGAPILTPEEIKRIGNKVYDLNIVKDVMPCTDEALKRYRL